MWYFACGNLREELELPSQIHDESREETARILKSMSSSDNRLERATTAPEEAAGIPGLGTEPR